MDERDDSRTQMIERLAADLVPVRIKSQRTLFLQYVLTLFIPGSLFLAILGFQADVSERAAALHFVLTLLLVASSTSVGCLLLVQYSRPGRAASRWQLISFFALLLAAALVQGARIAFSVPDPTWGPAIHLGWECSALSLGMSTLVAAGILVQLRHEAPVDLGTAGLFALLSASSLAGLVLQFHCPNGNPIHQVLWHLALPSATLAILAVPAGRLSLRW